MFTSLIARDFFNPNFVWNHSYLVSPKSYLKQVENGFSIEIDLPGVKKEDVQIDLKGRELRVSAKRKFSDAEAQAGKINEQKIEKNFELGEDVDTEEISAKLEDGVLRVLLNRSKERESKKISLL
jgi:HSP20 family protein